MSLDAPTPPDPTTTANTQQGYNKQSAVQSQQLNMIDQSNPYGSLTYQRVGTNPNGTPIYQATTKLTTPQQGLLNTQQQNQAAFGTNTSALTNQLKNQYAAGPQTDNSALTNQLLKWQTDYMQPYFTQQKSNLDGQLAAQGITQGSEAYNNAQRNLGNTQGGIVENAMSNDQQQAYTQAISNYLTPISAEIQGLNTFYPSSTPGSVSQNLVNTPTANISPADYSSIAEANYNAQNQNYQSTLNGLFSIPTSILGGMARGGAMSSMFSDRRLKTDVEVVGRLFDGTPIYRFRYKSGGPVTIGLMSDDVRKSTPEAVGSAFGYDAVDYGLATDAAARMAA